MRQPSRWKHQTVVATVLSLALVAGGCGGDDEFANSARPPAAITVSATIAPARVSVSPSHLGAGPVALLASNQTTTSQRVTLRSAAGATGGKRLEQSTGPINPGDTASLKADLSRGVYTVFVHSDAIEPARLDVGPPRSSGQDRLLQP